MELTGKITNILWHVSKLIEHLIAFNESSQNLTEYYGLTLKIGMNFSDLRKHMVLNHQKPPKGITIKQHFKNREKAWKNLKGQNTRESNFTDHTLHFTDTRLQDGSTICLWTDITDIKKQENELIRLRDGIETCLLYTSDAADE